MATGEYSLSNINSIDMLTDNTGTIVEERVLPMQGIAIWEVNIRLRME